MTSTKLTCRGDEIDPLKPNDATIDPEIGKQVPANSSRDGTPALPDNGRVERRGHLSASTAPAVS